MAGGSRAKWCFLTIRTNFLTLCLRLGDKKCNYEILGGAAGSTPGRGLSDGPPNTLSERAQAATTKCIKLLQSGAKLSIIHTLPATSSSSPGSGARHFSTWRQQFLAGRAPWRHFRLCGEEKGTREMGGVVVVTSGRLL